LFQCGSPPISKVGKCTVLSYLLGRMMPFARRTCASRDAVIDRLIGLVPETALRATQLDGKTFNPEKNLNPATQYGKGPFAEKVVVPEAKDIAWDGFRPLLDRISAVIADYVPPASAALAAAA
jgi:hypothetical protein